MAYRQRARPKRGRQTGITYLRQLKEVTPEYLHLLGEGAPLGAFDLEFWAEGNDHSCDPRSGGLSNVRSMAAVGGVSQSTLVHSIFPRIAHCLHREGPIVISTANTIAAACRDYILEQRAKQQQAGKGNAGNLIRWERQTDQSSGPLQDIRSMFAIAS